MINAFATIGVLALVFGAVFALYFGLRRVIRFSPVEPSKATLAEMAEWLPTQAMPLREPNDGGDIVVGNDKLAGSPTASQLCNPDYDAILDYNDRGN